ncbi:MAG: polysaccharide biosynthesis/export family protein [Planctomycetota bacterium]|jgi:hypothetical protein
MRRLTQISMRHVRNAVLATAIGVSAGALIGGCGAGGDWAEAQPPAGAEAVAAVAPRVVAPAVPDDADPLLARVKALAARMPPRAPRPVESSAVAAPSLPRDAASSDAAPAPAPVGPQATETGPRPRLADLLPRLRTGAAGARPRNESSGRAFALGAGDEIDLVVSGQPEFSGAVTVRPDGTVALPTTGDIVRAEGLTADGLSAAVADAVSPRYVKTRPAVSAVVRRSPRLAYYVFGAVRRPGRYEMPPPGVTVLDAVMRASPAPREDHGLFGATRGALEFVPVEGAGYSKVRVVAPGGGMGSVRIVDVTRAMRGGAEALDRVSAGGTVIVPADGGEWGEEGLGAALARIGDGRGGESLQAEEATP